MPLRNLTSEFIHSSESNSDSQEQLTESYTPSFVAEFSNDDDTYSNNDANNLDNPFLESTESVNPEAQHLLQESSRDSSNSKLRVVNERKVPNSYDYNGYYRINSQSNENNDADNILKKYKNTSGNNNGGSLQSPNFSISESLIQEPKPFDRYPKFNIVPKNRNGLPSTNSSSSSSNFLAGTADFSPFGGYPATSFPLSMDEKEDDDHIHNPDLEEESRLDKRRFLYDMRHMDLRSFLGLVGVLTLFLGGLALFVVLPALTFTDAIHRTGTTYEYVEVLTEYQYPTLQAIRTNLVDPDTPSDAKTITAKDGSTWKLVFSDEFNAEGRTFYAGDDQFWTAPDFHYAATADLEWYTPDAVTTKEGTVKLRMDAFRNHDLYYRSGMLQSWNKLCFTQGSLKISANLPNYGSVSGLWPGLWTMGNLGRPGYMATTDGVWPYSYDSCDAGITPNQSSPDGISYLPGQRLSACTCDGEDHPNPGTGRGAPEIDLIEAEADTVLKVGVASQSLQIAPFDIWYIPDYSFIEIYNFSTTVMNSYCGGPYQQAVSAVSTLNVTWYEFGKDSGSFQVYGLEYLNDDVNGYVRWFVGEKPTFTLYASALHPNGNIGWRRISKEPMSIIMNMGISNNWAYIDWQMIFFPVSMSVDYVRLYQPSNAISVTCDPDDYPTYDYIMGHPLAYNNPNLTLWKDANYSQPKNSLTGGCSSSNFTSKSKKSKLPF
ncbi:hypothetical protein KAFR_0C02070 [Kazachstania africana CBS 2517]|uniref:GH16 domain-containing protein n=1 Tax=Kazachstania africana (strain ATCC 22294 / BCRC 22015 / CBS 2517 / CECT 1963 / NBRC 1671 / NRRL Y-8276) TaxID=1071382 RepID=H2AS50_KAZAF|nr:hypothetical protein KAFR_0C02070 [Kazachstania africana CBS 2517]CCF57200.1 hypothetical protein KAFR_0C02070 [Kazachstania africana CBS 2517]